MREVWKKQAGWFLAGLVVLAVVAGIFFRFYNLSYPAKQVFDEVYFPVFANDYLHGISFYDVHPPLGKLIISFGILLFGNNGLGWRIMPALFGVLNIGLMGLLVWRMFKDRVMAGIVMLFVATDGLFVAYSRTGLMDGILFFAIFLCLLAAQRMQEKASGIGLGIALGLALAIKWPALAVAIPVFWFLGWHRKDRQVVTAGVVALGVYFLIVYIGQVLIGAPHPFTDALQWHVNAVNYHWTLTATHPWGSAWWSWPILQRPVLFLYDVQADGTVQLMTTLGNPLVWWASTVAVAGTTLYLISLFRKGILTAWQHPITPLVLGYYALWLPWAAMHRVVFLYHYFPSYGFALLILAYWLAQVWKRAPWAILGVLLVALGSAFYFMPWAVGWWGLSFDAMQSHVWLMRWLY